MKNVRERSRYSDSLLEFESLSTCWAAVVIEPVTCSGVVVWARDGAASARDTTHAMKILMVAS